MANDLFLQYSRYTILRIPFRGTQNPVKSLSNIGNVRLANEHKDSVLAAGTVLYFCSIHLAMIRVVVVGVYNLIVLDQCFAVAVARWP